LPDLITVSGVDADELVTALLECAIDYYPEIVCLGKVGVDCQQSFFATEDSRPDNHKAKLSSDHGWQAKANPIIFARNLPQVWATSLDNDVLADAEYLR
jgi:hypothetical protein